VPSFGRFDATLSRVEKASGLTRNNKENRLAFFVCTNTLDVKRSVVPLVFGVLLCAVLLYEHGFKLDANRRNCIWFMTVYLVPMAVMIGFVSWRLLSL
jgi:hypothetical protein